MGDFYPRPPRGGRRGFRIRQVGHDRFLSTPSARRATGQAWALHGGRAISIHALREEGDSPGPWWYNRGINFYPRPPRGGRLLREAVLGVRKRFLSTPSARRATAGLRGAGDPVADFYPRPPRGGRQDFYINLFNLFYISIHALRAEGDRLLG